MIVPYIELVSREKEDRLGANILSYICQIVYAYKFNYYIHFVSLRYENSVFIKSIKNFIDEYNSDKQKSDIKINICEHVNYAFNLHYNVIEIIETDIINYFINNLKPKYEKYLYENINLTNYILPYDPNNTILVHLRLDDLNNNNSFDYDGLIQGNFITEKIELKDKTIFNNFPLLRKEYFLNYYKEHLKYKKKILSVKYIPSIYGQSIIDETKIKNIINKIKSTDLSNKEVIIITSNKSKHNLEYRTITSDDPSLDLYFLCNCSKLILSRSTYALSSLFFTTAEEIWVPYNSMSASLGLKSKCDKNKFNYFY
jgi:hypothetical protein